MGTQAGNVKVKSGAAAIGAGSQALGERAVSARDIVNSVVITGDRNEVHINNEAFAGPPSAVIEYVENLLADYRQYPFVGRDQEEIALDTAVDQHLRLLLTAEAGFGKSALLAHWIHHKKQTQDCFVAYHFFRQQREQGQSVTAAYRHLITQLHQYYGLRNHLIPTTKEAAKGELVRLIREYGVWPERPLVIVLDALDEASEKVDLLLPADVAVIVSSRTDAEGYSPYLEPWRENSKHLHLTRLPHSALRLWLHQTKHQPLCELAEQPSFIDQFDTITDGYPLYIQHLLAELVRQTSTVAGVYRQMEHVPRGFENYVRQQLTKLDQLNLSAEAWRFLSLLTAILGPLAYGEIKEILQLRDRQLRQLLANWHINRWLTAPEEETEGRYAFTHRRLADVFAAQLGDEVLEVKGDLLNWCAQWSNHQQLYALRYYAAHLYEEEAWADLFQLVQDEQFLVAQLSTLLDSPDRPLETIALALDGALYVGDPAVVVPFIWQRAQWLHTLRQETPLGAWQQGYFARAYELADLQTPEQRQLWYLFLAAIDSSPAGALETLARLTQNDWELLRLSAPLSQAAIPLLQRLWSIDEKLVCKLASQLLPADALQQFARLWLEKGNLNNAWRVVKMLTNGREQAELLTDIGQAYYQQGEQDVATSLWQDAYEQVAEMRLDINKLIVWGDLGRAAASAQYQQWAADILTEAFSSAQQLPDAASQIWGIQIVGRALAEAQLTAAAGPVINQVQELIYQNYEGVQRAEALYDLIQLQMDIGLVEMAMATADQISEPLWAAKAKLLLAQNDPAKQTADLFDDLILLANQVATQSEQFELLREIALLQFRTQPQAAHERLAQVLQTAIRLDSPSERLWEIGGIAHTQAQAHQFTEALQTAEYVAEDAWLYAKLLRDIAYFQTQASKPAAAQKTVALARQQIERLSAEGHTYTAALREHAHLLIELGSLAEAHETIELITDEWEQSLLYGALCDAYLHQGRFEEAGTIAQQIVNVETRLERLATLCQAQFQTGDAKGGFETLLLVLTTSPPTDLRIPQLYGLLETVQFQRHLDDREAAVANLEAIQTAVAAIEDTWPREQLWLYIIELWVALEGFGAARKIIERELTTGWQKIEGWQTLVAGLAETQQFNKLRAIGTQLLNRSEMIPVVLTIAAALCAQGHMTDATGLIERSAFEIANEKDIQRQLDLSVQLGLILHECGMTVEAASTFAAIHERVCREAAEAFLLSHHIDSLLRAYVQLGEMTLVQEIIDLITEKEAQVDGWQIVAQAQLEQDDKAAFHMTVNQILADIAQIADSLGREVAFYKVVSLLVDAGELEEAELIANKISSADLFHSAQLEIQKATLLQMPFPAAMDVTISLADGQHQDLFKSLLDAQLASLHLDNALMLLESWPAYRTDYLLMLAEEAIFVEQPDLFAEILVTYPYTQEQALQLCGMLAYWYPDSVSKIADGIWALAVE